MGQESLNDGPIPRILVIEDDPATTEMLKKDLGLLGCAVTFTATAEEGIAVLSKDSFNAVLTDLCARIGGGRSVAQWIKKNNPSTKCFLITSWKGDLDQRFLDRDGVTGIIQKPVLLGQVREKLLSVEGITLAGGRPEDA